jgi:predicted MPP superfamily phosphohydrolase
MVTFLTVFFFLYGLLHFYVFSRVWAAVHLNPAISVALALFMVVMIIAPVIVRLSENAGWGVFGRIVAFVGYTWMGVLFLLVSTLILVDAYRLILYLLGPVSGRDLSSLTLSAGTYLILSAALVAVITVWGWFDARTIRSERIRIATPKISSDVSPLRIVQISDVHLGLIVRQDRLKRIMDQVRRAGPDLFVSTGDLVDGQMNDLDGVARLFEAVRPKYGKFAVTGNHEFYAGLDQALAFTRKAGFRLLRGEALAIPGVINIAGVDDPAGPGYGSSNKEERTLLSQVPKGGFALLLKHRPGVDAESLDLFDLQLSGHLHDGQIFPFRLITRLFYPFIAGLHRFPQGSSLYVSRGSGTWGPPIRFLAPPEVTIIDVRGEGSIVLDVVMLLSSVVPYPGPEASHTPSCLSYKKKYGCPLTKAEPIRTFLNEDRAAIRKNLIGGGASRPWGVCYNTYAEKRGRTGPPSFLFFTAAQLRQN